MSMDELIESIRVACANDASDDIKQRGAHACRTILTALDAKAGEPLAPATVAEGTNTATPAETTAVPPGVQIAALVGALRGMPPDQLLDMAIARLRAALPKDTPAAPAVASLRVPIIQIGSLVTATRSTEASKS